MPKTVAQINDNNTQTGAVALKISGTLTMIAFCRIRNYESTRYKSQYSQISRLVSNSSHKIYNPQNQQFHILSLVSISLAFGFWVLIPVVLESSSVKERQITQSENVFSWKPSNL